MKVVDLLRALLITIVLLYSCLLANKIYLKEKNQPIFPIKESYTLEDNQKIEIQNKLYNECKKTPFISESTKYLINKLLKEYENSNLSFYYKDIENQYSIKKDEKKDYYGASIIKLLEAIYLINQATNNKLDLEKKLTYEIRHISDYSLEMEKYKIGDKIAIKDLIKYAISVSDNTAHEMLYEFIGLENLKKYASSLKINLTINEREHFGELTTEDGMKIIEEAYKIIKENKKYKDLLTSSMNNFYYNSLNFFNINYLHKYGLTEEYYNEIGINLTNSPYLLSIFTSYGYENYYKIVKELSKKIYLIHKNNLDEKEKYCHQKAK